TITIAVPLTTAMTRRVTMAQSERTSTTARKPSRPLPRLDEADIMAARQRYTLADLLERHGIPVTGSGPRRTARCLFHDDQSPSLSVYLDSNRYYCFACGASGDAISLLQRLEGLTFREAVRCLTGEASSGSDLAAQVDTALAADARILRYGDRSDVSAPNVGVPASERIPDLLTVAAALYQAALTASPEAQSYVRQRHITKASARRMRVGFGQPGALHDYLADDPALTNLARQTGLLDAFGKERLEGRVIIPEIRDGRCLWMLGRTLTGDGEAPKYLGVTAPKPLMGVGVIQSHVEPLTRTAQPSLRTSRTGTQSSVSGVIVVEGPFDLLAVRQWRLPLLCVALVGAHASQRQMAELIALAAGRPIWLALDADAAGDAGADSLRSALVAARYAGPIYRLRPPLDAKDFGELTGVAGARMALLRMLSHPAEATLSPAAPVSEVSGRLTTRRTVEATP
ncbi:MAG: CHC2 zinc finger domain-containing protein, partial [Ktedonobacterales bacterium]